MLRKIYGTQINNNKEKTSSKFDRRFMEVEWELNIRKNRKKENCYGIPFTDFQSEEREGERV